MDSNERKLDSEIKIDVLIKEVLLDIFTRGIHCAISREEIMQSCPNFPSKIEAFEDNLLNMVFLKAKSFFVSYRNKEKKTIDIPSNWKESFKEEYFPSFLKKKFPIKYKKIVVEYETINICPHLLDEVPKNNHLYAFLTDFKNEK